MTLKLQIALITLLAVLLIGVLTWRNADFVSVWLTPDQRGRLAYEAKEFSVAAGLFVDSRWRATALYESGQYLAAAESYAVSADAVGLFNRGVALIKGREYAQAIASFELAAQEAPDWPAAQANLELARYLLDYVESAREQSGTDGELGADEYRYDASAERGERAVIDDRSGIREQSAEKWMRSVDTQTSEFLTTRFALEASRSGAL
jgi:Ca-activated chloride channel homolog